MATNLPDTENMPLAYDLAVVRAQRLDASCAPLTGNNARFITTGAVNVNASPQLREGAQREWESGTGDLIAEVNKDSKIRRWDLTGEFLTHDLELMEFLFGGAVAVGDTGTDYETKTISYAFPDLTDAAPNGVYIEFIGLLAYEGAGDCVASSSAPAAIKHTFTRARFVPGDVSLSADTLNLSFTARCTPNPTPSLDPFGDYQGAGSVPNKPYIVEGISQSALDAIIAAASPGYQDAA